ncbi:MAG TPA: hypothetical protein VH062_04585 [Polyangiaceae bacterium]|nr:hypothetical protein [Polyangiaceae bacterium]
MALISTAVLVGLGIWFRTRGMFGTPMPFWLDECAWGSLLFDKPLSELLIRPIGFMAVSKLIAAHVSASEPWLRALPWMAGLGTVVLSVFLGARLFKGWGARLFLVAALALNTEAIDYAREFKPYACGLFLHLAVLFLAVRAHGSHARRDLVAVLVVAVLAVLFTQDMVFAYPGLFGVLAADELRAKRRTELALVVGAALAAAGLLVVQYVFIWSRLGSTESEYWGNRYDVFFVGTGFAAHLRWHAEKLWDVLAFPGVHGTWSSTELSDSAVSQMSTVYRAAWLVLHLAGVTLLFRARRFAVATLLLLPLVTASLFNVAGLWPWGAFRTNTFLLAYTCSIAAFAFESRAWQWLGVAGLAPAAALLVPVFVLEPEWERQIHAPIRSLPMRDVVRELIDAQGPDLPAAPETLIVDAYHCEPWRYYSLYNPVTRAMLGADAEKRFRPVCAEDEPSLIAILRGLETKPGRVWLLRAKGKRPLGADRIVNKHFVAESKGRVGASLRFALRAR